jgi:3-hydroxyisobutyrate dehydrogenase
MHYGYIGLGNLGGHIAMNLRNAGYELTVYDLDPALAERHVKAGAHFAKTPAELAARVDHVFTCLPSPVVSRKVLDQILPVMTSGATWLENSTIGRDDIVVLSKIAAERGIRTLECPVTGGVHLAARGEITVLVGGDARDFELHEKALKAIGNKVITNMLAFIHLVADGEALMLAKRGGLDLGQAWAAIAASSGTSFVHETEGQLILNGSYDIAFSMDLALKDLGFAEGFGKEFGVPLELAAQTLEIFKRGKQAYGGQAQSTQIVKLLEDKLGTDLRAPGFPSRLT